MNIYVSRGGHFLNKYYLLLIFTIFFYTKPNNVQIVILI